MPRRSYSLVQTQQKNAKRFGIDEDKLYDVIIWGAIGALFGGRSFYVLFSDDYKVTSIRQFLNLRDTEWKITGVRIFSKKLPRELSTSPVGTT